MSRKGLAHGDGFLTARNGKWQARWKDGQTWRAKTFLEEEDAKDHLREIARHKRRGTYTSPSTMTVADIVADWLRWGTDRWKPSTVVTYRLRATHFVLPALGTTAIDRIGTKDIQAWVDGLKARGLGSSTIDCACRVISGAYKDAIRLGLIERNPIAGVRKPSIRQKSIPTWTAAEIGRVMATLADAPFWLTLYQFALATGIRPGELRALRWQDVNLSQGTALIARTVTRDADGLVVISESTKTGKPRLVAIPSVCVASLKRWQTAQKERRMQAVSWHDEDLLFDRGDGRFLPLTTWERWHDALIVRVGVRRITLHQLRHTAATLMLERGIHPKIVSEILGHAKIETTLNLYQHVSADLQRAAVEAMADSLFGTATPLENRVN